MSTKQSILYTLMIFFLAIMLVSIGMWFSASTKLASLKSDLEAKTEINIGLKRQLNGVGDTKGLINIVDDKQEGLAAKADDLLKSVPLLWDNPNDPAAPGVVQIEEKYKAVEPEVRKAWTQEAVDALNQSKKDREQGETDITAAKKRLAEARKEKEEKEVASAKDLAQEEATKETELKKIAQESSKMTQDYEAVRYQHEVTQQKVTEVSRNLSKVKAIVSQGKILGRETDAAVVTNFKNSKNKSAQPSTEIDPRWKIAFIDLGTRNGVRNGMNFDIYSGSSRQLVKKGVLEVVDASAFTSKCVILDILRENRWDPLTGWVPEKPEYNYSKYAAGGPDETDAQELVVRRTVKDKIETMRLEKIQKELGPDAAQDAVAATRGSSVPPSDLSLTLTPVAAGDWIFNADFVPIVSTDEFHRQIREELVSLRDVNVGALTVFIADTVRAYRKEFIKRMCEHNGCKVADAMNSNVNIVVSTGGATELDLVAERNASKKGKENLKDDDKNLIATEAALADAKKYGASIVAEDDMEAFFDRRARKQELLRGKLQQPGRNSFFIAGKTKYRSPELLAKYIRDHDGLVASDIEAKVDYVVVGESPDEAFVEKIKKLGLKIVREDELPDLLGVLK
ncbi:MAG: BRCT domain-containing protein [Planctomycetota bacterium]